MSLKKMLLFVLTVSLLSSCSKFTQVVYVAPTHDDITAVNHLYQYENDEVKVVYWFWAEHGIMSFFFWNKTDKPLYIDWKKSAMINNGKKLAYYTNKEESNYKRFGQNYGHGWVNIFNQYSKNSADFTASLETVVKDERITFVPPRSYVSNAFYNLVANVYFDVNDRNTEAEEVNFCKVFVSRSNKDIVFRNFLTYSHNEAFTDEMTVDNEFHISKVITMMNHQFEFKDPDGDMANDWERPTRFYIKHLSWSEVYDKNTPQYW